MFVWLLLNDTSAQRRQLVPRIVVMGRVCLVGWDGAGQGWRQGPKL